MRSEIDARSLVFGRSCSASHGFFDKSALSFNGAKLN